MHDIVDKKNRHVRHNSTSCFVALPLRIKRWKSFNINGYTWNRIDSLSLTRSVECFLDCNRPGKCFEWFFHDKRIFCEKYKRKSQSSMKGQCLTVRNTFRKLSRKYRFPYNPIHSHFSGIITTARPLLSSAFHSLFTPSTNKKSPQIVG